MVRKNIRDRDGDDPKDDSAEAVPDGVLHVTVGRRRRQVPADGAREAHVARIHDLPSLIRAVVEED